MLEINTNFNKYKIPTIFTSTTLCVFILFSYLTFIPMQTSAIDTADPNETRTLMQIDTMQEMTEQICANTKEHKTKQLKDARDGKYYWVTKLKDGNCWMTQNLDYDDPNSLRINTLTQWSETGLVSNATAAYYDPGDYYYAGNNDSYGPSENCANTVGLSDCGNFTTDGFNRHYHVGNYYSWQSAVDRSGLNLATNGEKAPISICPSGWQLPNIDIVNDLTIGSFKYMLQQYNLLPTAASESEYHVYSEPLYLTYGGIINERLFAAGSSGNYWTSTVASVSDAYILSIYSNINPNGVNRKNIGRSIRCLALGGWLPVSPDEKKANLAITVSPVISIDATSGMSSEVDFTTVAYGDITATISSNQKYQVLLSTNQSTLEQSPIVPNHNIPMITTDTTITPGTRAWGTQKTNATLYSPIGIGNNKVLFYESLGAESKTITFPVAISVDSTLPSGTYATEVTITATAN